MASRRRGVAVGRWLTSIFHVFKCGSSHERSFSGAAEKTRVQLAVAHDQRCVNRLGHWVTLKMKTTPALGSAGRQVAQVRGQHTCNLNNWSLIRYFYGLQPPPPLTLSLPLSPSPSPSATPRSTLNRELSVNALGHLHVARGTARLPGCAIKRGYFT